MNRAWRAFAAASVLMLALAGCGGGEKVGSAFKDFKDTNKGGDRIGEVTDSPTPKPKSGGGSAPAATEAPQEQPKSTPQASTLTVKITTAGFDPTAARVVKGSNITVTNTDSAAHTYTASDGTYDSGSLGAGQSTTFKAGTPGSFQMEDRTRNWIIGSLQVVG